VDSNILLEEPKTVAQGGPSPPRRGCHLLPFVSPTSLDEDERELTWELVGALVV
jgi:hypothetical protein